MADLLALSWDRRRLSGIELSSGTAGSRILAGFSVDWPEQPPTATWLRETLKRAGISTRQVAVALPREDAVLRLLELPNVSDDEMPTLVRFQAAARSAQSIDQLLLDYLPLPLRSGVAQKEVWLATTLLTTVDPIRSLLIDAGLDLVQLTLSSLCLTELIARGEARQSLDAAGASLVVMREGARMELAVVCQRQLIAAHAVKWSSINEIPPVAKMLAEVSRVLVQVQAWLPEGTLQRAWIIGEDADVGDLPDAVSQRWKCPVQRFDPWRDCQFALGTTKLDGPSSEYAIAAGLALIQDRALSPKLDLLHPRQPPPKRDPRKPYVVAAAAGGLLIAAFGTAIVQQSLSSYDRAIDDLQRQENELNQRLKTNEPIALAAKDVKEWQVHNVNQVSQIAELHEIMNGTHRVVISDFNFISGLGNVNPKLKVTGRARDRTDFQQLAQSLADLPKFNVPPTEVKALPSDPDYASKFDLDMELLPFKKKTSTPVTPAPNATTSTTNQSK